MLETPNFLAYAAARRRNAIPSDDLIAARYHVAVITWRAPVLFSQTGAERVCWIIVTHDREISRTTSITGETLSMQPMNDIVAAVTKVVHALDQPAWVPVSKKRVRLASALARHDIPTTKGLVSENLAVPRALMLAAELPQQARRVALNLGWRPNRSRKTPKNPLSDANGFNTQLPSIFWLPDFEHIKPTPNAHLIICTDAAQDQQSAAISAVATGGLGSLKAVATGQINELEFNAITLGLQLVRKSGASSATILSDNQFAVTAANAVLAGLKPAASYLGIRQNALTELATEIKTCQADIKIVRIKGHSGNLLNEIADQVAVLARIASQYPRDLVALELHLRVAALWASTANITKVSYLEETRIPAIAEKPSATIVNDVTVNSELARASRLTHSNSDFMKPENIAALLSITA